MNDIDLDKTITAIGKQIEPRCTAMTSYERDTFQEMVKDVTDSIVKINTLNALTTCYNNSQDASDKSFFRNEIDKLLNNVVVNVGDQYA